MNDPEPGIYGGVDTHKDFHVAAVVDQTGRIVDVEPFPATIVGYRRLLSWMQRHGELVRVGVEGTGSYGAGLARHLAREGVEVVEVNRPNRQARRRRGKNDTVDAEAAARAALNGDARVAPKSRDGIVEAIRAIRVAFLSARDARSRIACQLQDLLVTAPDEIARTLTGQRLEVIVERCARFRPDEVTDPVEATKLALGSLARRYQALTDEDAQLRNRLDELVTQANPRLRAAKGVGPDVGSILLIAAGDNPQRLTNDAALAALCGASPIEASSGKTTRHRLNRGGNRQANHALWRIAIVRMQTHAETKAYVERRRAEGKTDREIIRCLKRFIAREIYRYLVDPHPVAATADLRPARQALGLGLKAVGDILGTWHTRISELERGLIVNPELEARYRAFLTSHAA